MHLGSLPQHTSIQRVSPWSQFPEPISYSLFTKCLSSSWITIPIISDFLSPSLSTSVSVYLFNEFFISHPNITTLMSKNPCYYFIQEHQLPNSQVSLSALTPGQVFAAWGADSKQGRWGWMCLLHARIWSAPGHLQEFSREWRPQLMFSINPHSILCLPVILLVHCHSMTAQQQISSTSILPKFRFASSVLATQLIFQVCIAQRTVHFYLRFPWLLCTSICSLSVLGVLLCQGHWPVQGISKHN